MLIVEIPNKISVNNSVDNLKLFPQHNFNIVDKHRYTQFINSLLTRGCGYPMYLFRKNEKEFF